MKVEHKIRMSSKEKMGKFKLGKRLLKYLGIAKASKGHEQQVNLNKALKLKDKLGIK